MPATATHELDTILETIPAEPEGLVDSAGDPIDGFADAGSVQAADASIPAAISAGSDGNAASGVTREGGGSAPETVPQADEFPEVLLREAGISADQARQQFGSADALERAVLWHVQQVAAAGRQRIPVGQRMQPATNVPPNQQTPASPQDQSRFQHLQPPAPDGAGQQQLPHTKGWYEPFAEKVVAMKDADGGQLFSESTVELIREMDRHNATQFDRLTSTIAPLAMRGNQAAQAMAEDRARRETEQVYQDMEKRFQSLGDDWSDTFGKGDARELYSADPNDPGVQARQRVASTMEALANGRATMGLEPLDQDILFQQALRAEFFPKLQDKVRREAVGQVTSRRNLQTLRPTQRKTPSPSQNQRTLAAVEQVLQKRGRTLGPPGEESPVDGF